MRALWYNVILMDLGGILHTLCYELCVIVAFFFLNAFHINIGMQIKLPLFLE